MKLRYLESLSGLVGPLHGTAHADGLLYSVRSVLSNTTHNLCGTDDPEVFAMDIGDEPIIRKLGDKFSEFIKYVIGKRLKRESW